MLKERISSLNLKGKTSALEEEEVVELHELLVNLHSLSLIRTSVSWQQARLRWLQEGDANTKFFNGSMLARRRNNSIQLLQVNGVQIEGVQNIRSVVFSHFSSHFHKLEVSQPGVENMRFCQLSMVEAGNLIRPFTLEEVKQAIWDCDRFKSPGPDGINFGYLNQFWNMVKDDFMRFIVEFHHNGRLTKGINATFISLIPKVMSPQRSNNFHWWDLCIRC